MTSSRLPSLADLAAEAVVDTARYYYKTRWSWYWRQYWAQLNALPATVKTRLLHIMSLKNIISDDNIDYLIHAQLEKLSLYNCLKSDHSINLLITTCPMLQSLDLGSRLPALNQISTNGFCDLFRVCNQLRDFRAENCIELNDQCAEILILRCCPRLITLELRGCLSVSDRTLKLVADWCGNIRRLNFSLTSISDDGLCHLAKGIRSTELEHLCVNDCSLVSTLSINLVRSSCPGLKVFRFEGTRVAHENLFELVAR